MLLSNQRNIWLLLQVLQLLKDLDGEFLKVIKKKSVLLLLPAMANSNEVFSYFLCLIFLFQVIHCTEDMLSLTVWDAMHTQQPNLEAVEVGSKDRYNFRF